MEICNDHGIEFIGPKPLQIRLMGDKSTAKDTMKVSRSNKCALPLSALLLLYSKEVGLSVAIQAPVLPWQQCMQAKGRVSRLRPDLNSIVEIIRGYAACRLTMGCCCWAFLQKAGVPCVPGSDGLIKDEAHCLEVVKEIGLPVMIKATAGGYVGGAGASTGAEYLTNGDQRL